MRYPALRVDPSEYAPEHMASGEVEFVCGFVERGINDFLGRDLGFLGRRKDSDGSRFLVYQTRLLAAEWLYDVADDGPFSFEWGGHICGLNVDRLRAMMQPLLVGLVREYKAFVASLEARQEARIKPAPKPKPKPRPKPRSRPKKPLTPEQQEKLARRREARREWEREYYAALSPERKAKYAEGRKEAKARWVARRSKAREKARLRREAKERINNGCKPRQRRKKG